MTAQEFINQYNGKGWDYDGNYGYQCVDLYHFYCRDVVGCSHPAVSNGAKQIWDLYDSTKLEKIPNTPELVPVLGDICIWNMSTYGHVAIATGVGDIYTFQSLDQNWPYGTVPNWNPAQICTHKYTNFLGVLRPKGGQMATDIQNLYQNATDQQKEIDALRAEVVAYKAIAAEQFKQMALRGDLDSLKTVISEIPQVKLTDFGRKILVALKIIE